MTKFDIRLRRNQFTQSRIERHKNFRNLMGSYDRTSRRKTRGLMVLVFLVILIIAILLAFFNASKEPNSGQSNESVSIRMKISKLKDIDNIATVYKT